MKLQRETLQLLRRAGETPDDHLDIGETALALAMLERSDAQLAPYRAHLAALETTLRAEGPALRLEDQLRLLRQAIVLEGAYQGEEETRSDEARQNNFMDVIDRRRGNALTLGILYLHLAHRMGWAMTGIDLGGLFLLRLSAADGTAVIDPFRAGQLCQIQAVDEDLDDAEEEGDLDLHGLLEATREISFSDEMLRPLNKREVLLRLQHRVKRRLLTQDKVEGAITTLQGMILFAPRQNELWRELGCLQAERGHIRAAITALEVVKDLADDPLPVRQTGELIRELRWRLN